MRPAAVTPSDVRRYVAELVARGDLAAKMINNSLAVLRVSFAHLEEDGDLLRNQRAARPAGASASSFCPSTARRTTSASTRSRAISTPATTSIGAGRDPDRDRLRIARRSL
jgi:hypothetical protein